MGTGILICGLNGSGKSTFGKALAEKLNFHFIDNEDLYFPKTNPDYMFSSPRTREEVEKLLFDEIRLHESFVFTSVRGDYGEEFYPYLQCVVVIEVPREIRMRRVRNRSYLKFGGRMLEGGDLYEREERFFALVESRPENIVEEWLKSLRESLIKRSVLISDPSYIPVIRIDGTKSVDENIDFVMNNIKK